MGKNAAETFFERTLRTRLLFFMKIVEELELVLLIVTVGNFKRFLNLQSRYDIGYTVKT